MGNEILSKLRGSKIMMMQVRKLHDMLNVEKHLTWTNRAGERHIEDIMMMTM